MSLVTDDMVRRELGLGDKDDPDLKAWIEDRITLVSAELPSERWCAQRLEYGTLTIENRASYRHPDFLLPYMAVVSIASLSYRDDEFDDWTVIDPTNYQLIEPEDQGGLYRVHLKSVVLGRWYRFVLNVGYWPADNSNVPPAGVEKLPRGLQAVALDMIAYDYDQIEGKRRGLASKSSTPGGLSTSYVSRETKEREWARALAPYRRARGL